MIYVHIADGTEEIEFVTIVDVLRRGGLDVLSVSVNGDGVCKGAHGISIFADILIEEADYDACDMIVLPGGLDGTMFFKDFSPLIEPILDFTEQNKAIAAICAAPLVLDAAGILEGKKAVIYPGMEKHISSAQYVDQNVVIDGNIITSKGPGTAMEFAIAIVEYFKGVDCAREVKKGLLME